MQEGLHLGSALSPFVSPLLPLPPMQPSQSQASHFDFIWVPQGSRYMYKALYKLFWVNLLLNVERNCPCVPCRTQIFSTTWWLIILSKQSSVTLKAQHPPGSFEQPKHESLVHTTHFFSLHLPNEIIPKMLISPVLISVIADASVWSPALKPRF